MDLFLKRMNEDAAECSFNDGDILKCPFLRNINKPTSFSFSSVNFPLPVSCCRFVFNGLFALMTFLV